MVNSLFHGSIQTPEAFQFLSWLAGLACAPSMASHQEVAVFADTNLGTCIAMAVPPDTTAGQFKKQLEKAHSCCFPNFGEIQVYGVMVKEKSCFYHLPESIPIKHAFQGLKRKWFLWVEAKILEGSERRVVVAEAGTDDSNGKTVTGSPVTCNGRMYRLGCGEETRINTFDIIKSAPQELPNTSSKKKRVNRLEHGMHETEKECHSIKELPAAIPDGKFSFLSGNEIELKFHPLPVVQTPSENSMEVTSMSDVSKSRCQQLEVESDRNWSGIKVGTLPQFTVRTPARTPLPQFRVRRTPRTPSFLSQTDPKPGPSRNKPRGAGVGKRLVIASNNLRMSQRKQGPAVSVCRSKNRKLIGCGAASVAKYLVFEISDSDD